MASLKSSETVALTVTDVWKRYRVTAQERPATLKTALVNRFAYWRQGTAYWALQGVNFRILRGQSVGLIGNNGAGKSTLFRLITGLSRPTRGSISRTGRIGSLLELGAGFNLEFTGRENVITGSLLAGLTRKEAEARLPEVIAFAELEDFIDQPLRTYSNGMFVRLAFATEISLNPDILLIDEVLAVGDLAFQRKCLTYLQTLRGQGKTLIVVSHSMDQILKTCEEVIWLEHGTVRAMGAVADVVRDYQKHTLARHTTAPRRAERTGTEAVSIDAVTLYTASGDPTESITSGDGLLVHISLTAHAPLANPIFQVAIFNSDGIKCCESDTHGDAGRGTLTGTASLSLTFATLPLAAGSYSIAVGVYAPDWAAILAYRAKICPFVVGGVPASNGVLYTPHMWGDVISETPPPAALLQKAQP